MDGKGRFLDTIFLVDMCLQFFVAYQRGNEYGGWTWVTDHNMIMQHYLRSWFVVDAATVFVPGGCSSAAFCRSSA